MTINPSCCALCTESIFTGANGPLSLRCTTAGRLIEDINVTKTKPDWCPKRQGKGDGQ